MDVKVLLQCLILDMSLQWAVYVVSAGIRNERFFDLTGSFTFFVLAYLSYEWSGLWTLRQTIQTAMICTWAFRLGLYLFIRILKSGEDQRFNNIRDNPARFFAAWTAQGVWVFVTLLPTLVLNTQTLIIPLTIRDYIGWSLWLIGFVIEVTADYQKTTFRNNPDNKGKFICSGLWKYSRHPNYCGEIILWFGLYVSASSVLKGYQLLLVLCPVFDYLLITKWSGIPPLEKLGIQRWGRLIEYRKYLAKTPELFPF